MFECPIDRIFLGTPLTGLSVAKLDLTKCMDFAMVQPLAWPGECENSEKSPTSRPPLETTRDSSAAGKPRNERIGMSTVSGYPVLL